VRAKPLDNTLIRTDRTTRAKLKERAGDKPLTAYLREIADGVVTVPISDLEALRKSLLNRMDALDKKIDRLDYGTTRLFGCFDEKIVTLCVIQGLTNSVLDMIIPGIKEEIAKQTPDAVKKAMEDNIKQAEEDLKDYEER
jgi:hypothetical protein